MGGVHNLEANKKTTWSYDSVSNFYEKLANIYSFGMIRVSKDSQLQEMRKGEKVLYVGVGSGEDAIKAARLGADVTCIDLSPKMLSITKQRFEKESLVGNFICDDITKYENEGYFDVVTANYFLNNFSKTAMLSILQHLTTLLKQNGKLMIADFVAPSNNVVVRAFQKLNYYIAVTFFWLARVAPFHKMQDYSQYFSKIGLKLDKVSYMRFMRIGPITYGSITGVKISK